MRFPGLNEAELNCEIERMRKTIDPCSSEDQYMDWLANELVMRDLENRVSELVDALVGEAASSGVA